MYLCRTLRVIEELSGTKRQERSIADGEQHWQMRRVMKDQEIFREWILAYIIGKVQDEERDAEKANVGR